MEATVSFEKSSEAVYDLAVFAYYPACILGAD